MTQTLYILRRLASFLFISKEEKKKNPPLSSPVEYLTRHTQCANLEAQCPLKSVLPSRALAQHWEVLPSPATEARIPVSEPGTLRTEKATYQKLSIISFQYTSLGNWGVTSSSPFSSYLQPLAATTNRYIISQKQKNQDSVLFDLLNLL